MTPAANGEPLSAYIKRVNGDRNEIPFIVAAVEELEARVAGCPDEQRATEAMIEALAHARWTRESRREGRGPDTTERMWEERRGLPWMGEYLHAAQQDLTAALGAVAASPDEARERTESDVVDALEARYRHLGVPTYAWEAAVSAAWNGGHAQGKRANELGICGVICAAGRLGEPMACAWEPGHDGPHSWATLPTFTDCR